MSERQGAVRVHEGGPALAGLHGFLPASQAAGPAATGLSGRGHQQASLPVPQVCRTGTLTGWSKRYCRLTPGQPQTWPRGTPWSGSPRTMFPPCQTPTVCLSAWYAFPASSVSLEL